MKEKTGASRTTIRLDVPKWNCHVDRVCAESLAPGIASLRPNTSLNQRALKTCIFINETGKALIQNDTQKARTQPPKALMDVYGVKAQMLVPLMFVDGDGAGGWISVHFVPGPRTWGTGDVEALFGSAREFCRLLKDEGWMERELIVKGVWAKE